MANSRENPVSVEEYDEIQIMGSQAVIPPAWTNKARYRPRPAHPYEVRTTFNLEGTKRGVVVGTISLLFGYDQVDQDVGAFRDEDSKMVFYVGTEDPESTAGENVMFWKTTGEIDKGTGMMVPGDEVFGGTKLGNSGWKLDPFWEAVKATGGRDGTELGWEALKIIARSYIQVKTGGSWKDLAGEHVPT